MNFADLAWRLQHGRRAQAASELRSVGERLDSLMQITERDFLAVGSQLGAIQTGVFDQASTLQRFSSSVEAMESGLLAQTLEDAVRWADVQGADSGWGAALDELLGLATALRFPLSELLNALRALRVLRVVTRVESARLGLRGAGFEALAGELAEMSSHAEASATRLIAGVNGLCALLRGAWTSVAQLETRQREHLRALLADSAGALSEAAQAQTRAGAMSRAAAEGYGRVAEGVREIFTALQFHDSTRQRLEHIRSALDLLAAELESAAPPSAAVVWRSLELQAAQLREARASFLDSVGRVRRDLIALGCLARRFSDSAREVASPRQPVEGAPCMPARCDAVAEAVKEWIASCRELGEAGSSASEACASIAGFTELIESVGVRMLWLALNAEIQAVALEASGVVMEAVAEGIRAVSQRAAGAAAAIAAALREVQSRVATLTGGLKETGDANCRDASAIESRMHRVILSMEGARAGQSPMLEAISSGGDRVAGAIAALCESISAHVEMDRVSDACLETFGGVADMLRRAAGRAATVGAPSALLSAAEGYTMHAEREIHLDFEGGAPPLEVAQTAHSEFGANVELF